MQPFSAVENAEFIKYLLLYNHVLRVPNRHIICCRLLAVLQDQKVEAQNAVLRHVPEYGKVSMSSRAYRRCTVITTHRMDSFWNMKRTVIQFNRFQILHTRNAVRNFIYDFLKEWTLTKSLHSIATNNASEMCPCVKKLYVLLYSPMPTGAQIKMFHVQCVAHVINLGLKKCMQEVPSKIEKKAIYFRCQRVSEQHAPVLEH